MRYDPLSPDRRLALRFMRSGYATAAEIAALLGISRQVVHGWSRSKARGAKQITDYAQARERRLVLQWRAAKAMGYDRMGDDPPQFDNLMRDDWESGAPPAPKREPVFNQMLQAEDGRMGFRDRDTGETRWTDDPGPYATPEQIAALKAAKLAKTEQPPAPPSNPVADAFYARLQADAAPADTRTIDEIIAAGLARSN